MATGGYFGGSMFQSYGGSLTYVYYGYFGIFCLVAHFAFQTAAARRKSSDSGSLLKR